MGRPAPSGVRCTPIPPPAITWLPSASPIAIWASGNAPLSFRWHFGDGTTATGTYGDTPGVETRNHTYDSPGTYLVALTLADENGDVGMATTQVVVAPESGPSNRPPIADASEERCVITRSLVVLDGTGSHDPDDGTPPAWDQLTFDWQFLSKPPGSDARLNDRHVVGPSFYPDVDGDYLIRLVVSDGVATSSDTVLIEASSQAVLFAIGDTERYGDAGDPQPVSEPLAILAQNDCQTLEPTHFPDLAIDWEAENAAVESVGTAHATTETDDDGFATIASYFGESAQWGVVHARSYGSANPPDASCAAAFWARSCPQTTDPIRWPKPS